MRAKVVHASLDCSVLLAGKSWSTSSEHGGNLHSEQEHKVAIFSIITVSITFLITGGGAKVAKCAAQNRKDEITKYLN